MPNTTGDYPMPYPNSSAVPDVPGDVLALAQAVDDALTTEFGGLPSPGSVQIIPTAATNGSVSSTGVVTSTAQSLVRVRTAFPAGFTVFQIDYDITTSASSVNARLAVDGSDATTAYDNQRFTIVNATATAVQALNAGELQLSPIALAARHVGRLIIHNPNVATQAVWNNSAIVTADPMTTSAGLLQVGGQHRTATAYNSISFYPPSGTLTVNRLTVKGLA